MGKQRKKRGENQYTEDLGVPVYVDLGDPKIKDAAMQQDATIWMGANDITFKLLRCVESIRDIAKIVQLLNNDEAVSYDRRGLKLLSTPLYSLACGIRDMFRDIEGNAKNYHQLTIEMRREYKKRSNYFEAQIPLDKESVLKAVRDKIGSHIDKDSIVMPDKYWQHVNVQDYFHWLGVCLIELVELLNLDIYGWTRDSGTRDIVSLMSIDGRVVDFKMENGRPTSIVNIHLTRSPKEGIGKEIDNLITIYNDMISTFNA